MVEEIEKDTGSSNPESETEDTAWRERRRFHRHEKPPMEFIRLPVMVWDHRAEEWKRGAMRDATLVRDIITLTWTNEIEDNDGTEAFWLDLLGHVDDAVERIEAQLHDLLIQIDRRLRW